MDIDDKFKFGQYKGLTLKEVYQGTEYINLNLLSDYLSQCLLDTIVPKIHEFEVCDITINEGKINIIPQIFNEELEESQENIIYLGDISKKLEIYFNQFFNKNWLGIANTFTKYNSLNFKEVIGADPEYINWCLSNIDNFLITEETKSKLENLAINRLMGIRIEMINLNEYCFYPIINKELFVFNKNNKVKNTEIKQTFDKLNQSKQQLINWDFIIKHKIYFNQLFSAYYNFSEKELITLKNKLAFGRPYLVLESGSFYCKTVFGLIFNNEILWTDQLRKLYLKDSYVRFDGSTHEYNFNIDFDKFPLSFSEEYEFYKSEEIYKHLDTYDNSDEFIGSISYFTEYEFHLKQFDLTYSKHYFNDNEIIDIIESNDIEYIFNNNFYLQLLRKISSDMSDFSIEKFYLDF